MSPVMLFFRPYNVHCHSFTGRALKAYLSRVCFLTINIVYFIVDVGKNGHPPVALVRSISSEHETKRGRPSIKMSRQQSYKVHTKGGRSKVGRESFAPCVEQNILVVKILGILKHFRKLYWSNILIMQKTIRHILGNFMKDFKSVMKMKMKRLSYTIVLYDCHSIQQYENCCPCHCSLQSAQRFSCLFSRIPLFLSCMSL